jgi:hypothetical protein
VRVRSRTGRNTAQFNPIQPKLRNNREGEYELEVELEPLGTVSCELSMGQIVGYLSSIFTYSKIQSQSIQSDPVQSSPVPSSPPLPPSLLCPALLCLRKTRRPSTGWLTR